MKYEAHGAPSTVEIKTQSFKAADPVNHPPHYKNHPSGIECIEITRHFNFNRGNAIKYIWRAGDKGEEIQDLQKAIWYLNDEIKKLKEVNNQKGIGG